eukprot:595701-Pelagomonas_calceolata.AAC.3
MARDQGAFVAPQREAGHASHTGCGACIEGDPTYRQAYPLWLGCCPIWMRMRLYKHMHAFSPSY